MSDKRIYGASGSDGSSETDESDAGESGPPLGAIGQDTEKSERSESSRAGGCGSGAPLTGPSGSGSSGALGARPKVGHGGKSRGKRNADVWHNERRRSAKSLRGKGQLLAANEGKDGGKKEGGRSSSGLRAVECTGPRGSRYGRGGRREGKFSLRGELRGYTCAELLCTLLSLAIMAGAPVVLLLVSLSDAAKSAITGRENASAGEISRHDIVTSAVSIFSALIFFALLIRAAKSSMKKDKK
ncbi:hypothetical protein [Candidatus Ichthyocystis sparus]|uniref:hypothetical protein n=1 Tax=Candidatus Ichthyocystis sparus TaxID=1561004 RepID=UPI0011465B83|nr:hypothetical protein [Candidatus Ichthyocystis sparus]